MSESQMRQRVIKLMRHEDAGAVENKVVPGTPDVQFVEGWCELKWMRTWPKNADTDPVLIKHFTPQQRVWLKRRWRAGGNVWLLLQANGRDWLLFDGETAAIHVGRVTRPRLYELAHKVWHKLDEKELRLCLKQRPESSRHSQAESCSSLTVGDAMRARLKLL